jgi:hypothetical protein
MGQAAREYVEKNFDIPELATRLGDVIETELKGALTINTE